MTQYFYAVGSERRGPVPLDELRTAGITPSTLVWYEGLPDWKPAGELPELNDLFVAAPPPHTPERTGSGIPDGERVDPPKPPPAPAYPPPPAATLPGGAQAPVPGERRSAHSQLGGPPPKSYLLESILVTVLCCLPLGIVGIVNASKVESRYYAGDAEQAHYYSREAKKWCKYGLIAAAVLGGFWFVGTFLFGFLGSY